MHSGGWTGAWLREEMGSGAALCWYRTAPCPCTILHPFIIPHSHRKSRDSNKLMHFLKIGKATGKYCFGRVILAFRMRYCTPGILMSILDADETVCLVLLFPANHDIAPDAKPIRQKEMGWDNGRGSCCLAWCVKRGLVFCVRRGGIRVWYQV